MSFKPSLAQKNDDCAHADVPGSRFHCGCDTTRVRNSEQVRARDYDAAGLHVRACVCEVCALDRSVGGMCECVRARCGGDGGEQGR